MDTRDWRESFRPDIPGPARMYNYFPGGKHRYPADGLAAEQVIAASPEVLLSAILRHAVRHLVTECGIRQFIAPGRANRYAVVARCLGDG